MIPQTNPYTVRGVSDIQESNGSSSMATVCAGTLSTYGCRSENSKASFRHGNGLRYRMTKDANNHGCGLSDILGDEDHLGDMDFKVTGTSDGITACQMDISKIQGLSYEILAQALELSQEKGRLHILDKRIETDVLKSPREAVEATNS